MSITSALNLMWTYAGLTKLSERAIFQQELTAQPFSDGLSPWLSWLIPGIGLLTVLLLCFSRTRFKGLVLSTLMITCFTLYIIVLWIVDFRNMPCSCAGISKALNWKSQFLFNCFFLAISIIGCYLAPKIHVKKEDFQIESAKGMDDTGESGSSDRKPKTE